METERIALSQRERDRLRVLHEIRQKQITLSEAARRLKISDRHIRRLLVACVRPCGTEHRREVQHATKIDMCWRH